MLCTLQGCGTSVPAETEATVPLDDTTKNYWYSGLAEISSYDLKQARYGEMRNGESVMIFVTEDYSPSKGTKVNKPSKESVSVLKLNFTKHFVTGIYPYSMMTSTFFPMEEKKYAMKVSMSAQEWCGQSYMELQNRAAMELQINSYFEDESGNFSMDREMLEDELWSVIRLYPEAFPTGSIELIPSFFYLRLMHREAKAYEAVASVTVGEAEVRYQLEYPQLERTLSITAERDFPRRILAWEETYYDGKGDDRHLLTTSGRLKTTIRTDYWTKNALADTVWRDSLLLE